VSPASRRRERTSLTVKTPWRPVLVAILLEEEDIVHLRPFATAQPREAALGGQPVVEGEARIS